MMKKKLSKIQVTRVVDSWRVGCYGSRDSRLQVGRSSGESFLDERDEAQQLSVVGCFTEMFFTPPKPVLKSWGPTWSDCSCTGRKEGTDISSPHNTNLKTP